jgi:error-prone DNA polymerase
MSNASPNSRPISPAVAVATRRSQGRGNEARNGSSGPDTRELPPKGLRTRDIYIPELHIDTIKVKARNSH